MNRVIETADSEAEKYISADGPLKGIVYYLRKKTDKFFRRGLVLTAVLVVFLSCGESRAGKKQNPAARNGVMDLSSWDFHRDGAAALDGQWDFYWKKLLTSEDFTRSVPVSGRVCADVPATWKNYTFNNNESGSFGFATFRLLIMLPPAEYPLALRFLEMRSAYRAFLNGKLIAANGSVGVNPETSKPQYLPLVADLGRESGTVELIVHVSNYHTTTGGIVHPIQIGLQKDIHNKRENNIAFQLFLLGSLLIMGLFLTGMFFIQKVDRSPLFLGMFCLLISVRPLVTGEYFLIHQFPGFSWEIMLKLEYLSLYTGLPLFMTFMYTLFPLDLSKRFLRIVQTVGALFSVIVIVTPVQIYSRSILFYELFTLVIGAYILYIVIVSTVRRREGAAIFLFGTFVMMLTVTNEIFYDLRIINTGHYFPIGVFIFILSQSVLISLRFSKTYERNRMLSLIEQELKLAEKIQLSTLPEDTPRVAGMECSTLYIPSAYVGGDFYDFHQIDSAKTGFIIADISGHGVPAAMITSMIKVIFFMLKHLAHQPAAFLKEMNSILLDILKDNFATVGYVFIDLDRMTAGYARGGHEPLLLYRKSENAILEYMPNGRMLGPFSEINCETAEFEISPGDRLILYTDGITELFNSRREMFGLEAFKSSIIEKRDFSQSDFIESISQQLREWSGDEEGFNDDVTILLIDIV